MTETRKLYRTPGTAMLGGVCAGLARYFDLDPTVVRLVAVVLCFVPPLSPVIIIGYIVAWIVVPNDPEEEAAMPESYARREEAKERVVERTREEIGKVGRGGGGNGRVIFGGILVLVGLVLLADQFDLFDHWFFWRFWDLWPLLLVVLGLVLVARGLGRDSGEPARPAPPPAGPPPADPPPAGPPAPDAEPGSTPPGDAASGAGTSAGPPETGRE